MPVPSLTHLLARSNAASYRWVAGLFFVSGAIALVYEIIWQRQFALLMGSAAPAAAAVLAGYFAGLGTGAFVVGRASKRIARPLRAYAVLELVVAVGALLVAPALSWFELGYYRWFESLEGNSGAFMVVRTAITLCAVFVPTFAMGGTLPLLGSLVDQGRKELGLTAGWLYVVNTLGAGLGALAVPFLLIPTLGVSHTVACCAAINAALAVAAWIFDRRLRYDPPSAVRKPVRPVEQSSGQTRTGQSFGFVIISGFVTFALQVVWNRAFAQVHENSLYSFAVIVAVNIFALAAGAQISRAALTRKSIPRRTAGAAWMLGGILTFFQPWLFLEISHGLDYLVVAGGWGMHALQLVTMASAVLFVPTALLGVAFPAILEDAGRTSSDVAGSVIGKLLAANIAGSVAGALVAGFWLPSWVGMWTSVFWLGLLVLATGSWQWMAAAKTSAGWKRGLIISALALACLWPLAQIDLPRVKLASANNERMIALTEGAHGITAVVERRGTRRLKLNNHYGLGGTASTGDERMQAHIPLILHPAPHRVAFLGLGTGITAGGSLFHPIEGVTAVELVPEVIAASRQYFSDANRAVVDDPRTRVVADDARQYLRGSGARFDVIIGDLVVPWRQGEGALFTLEQFTAARDALAPGGIFCQWLPLFQLSELEATILARTFLARFAHVQVWRGDFSPTEPAIALIAVPDGFEVNAETVQRRLSEMQADSSNPQLASADAFLMNYVGELDTKALPLRDPRLNTEDRPWIELLGPMLHSGSSTQTLFTGRRLQAWLEGIRQRTEIKTHPAIRETRAVAAGSELAEMTLCLSEGNRDGAIVAQRRLSELLSAQTFKLLFP